MHPHALALRVLWAIIPATKYSSPHILKVSSLNSLHEIIQSSWKSKQDFTTYLPTFIPCVSHVLMLISQKYKKSVSEADAHRCIADLPA